MQNYERNNVSLKAVNKNDDKNNKLFDNID